MEYQVYLEDEKHRTEVVPGKCRDPEFGYQKKHTQSVVTEQFLKYVKDEVLVFKVYGFPDVKKQGESQAASKQKKQSKIKSAAQEAMA